MAVSNLSIRGQFRDASDKSRAQYPIPPDRIHCRINNAVIGPKDLQVMYTIGDGTCLIHSFLLCCSSIYRSFPEGVREPVGQEVRRYLHTFMHFNANYANEALQPEEIDKLKFIARTNVLIIRVDARIVVEYTMAYDPMIASIIIAQTDRIHYCAVKYKNTYQVDRIDCTDYLVNTENGQLGYILGN